MPWEVVEDFSLASRNGAKCSMCSSLKKKEDPGVFRGSHIHTEGFFDMCMTCWRQLYDVAAPIDEKLETTQRQRADNLEAEVVANRRTVEKADQLMAAIRSWMAEYREKTPPAPPAPAPAKKATKRTTKK